MASLPEVQNLKLPPQSQDAEQSVLGGMLIDNESIHKVVEVASEEDFYREAHRKIFSSIVSLYQHNEPADLVTVTTDMPPKGGVAPAS